jgi:hypothetical protein
VQDTFAFYFLLDFFLQSTYTTMQLQRFALQLHSKIVQRENSHGNEESSEEGRKESRQESRKEKVTTNEKRLHERGARKRSP